MMDNDTGNAQTLELQIQLRADSGIDADAIDALTRSLSAELQEIPGAVDVKLAPSEEMAPQDAKSVVEMAEIGALLLAILPDAIPALIEFLKEWALRPGSPPVTLKIKQGKKSIELEYDPRTTSVTEIAKLLDAVKP